MVWISCLKRSGNGLLVTNVKIYNLFQKEFRKNMRSILWCLHQFCGSVSGIRVFLPLEHKLYFWELYGNKFQFCDICGNTKKGRTTNFNPGWIKIRIRYPGETFRIRDTVYRILPKLISCISFKHQVSYWEFFYQPKPFLSPKSRIPLCCRRTWWNRWRSRARPW